MRRLLRLSEIHYPNFHTQLISVRCRKLKLYWIFELFISGAKSTNIKAKSF